MQLIIHCSQVLAAVLRGATCGARSLRPPVCLSHVIHAGGVLRDATLPNQSAGTLRAPFAAKGHARAALHAAMAPAVPLQVR